MKVSFVFAWYDLWVGVYWDRKNRHLYLMVPLVGIRLEFRKPENILCPSDQG